jgi:hypothetical protein
MALARCKAGAPATSIPNALLLVIMVVKSPGLMTLSAVDTDNFNAYFARKTPLL